MRTYILRRLLQMIPTLLIISFLIFGLLYLTPGDPVLIMLGAGESQTITQEQYDKVKEDLGLNKPFMERYLDFVVNALRGDLGESYVTGKQVFDEIMLRMPATLALTFAAVFVGLLLAIPLGILAAKKHNSIWDNIATFFATIGVSLPKFWFALVLIIFLSLKLKLFPSSGIAYISEDGLFEAIRYITLPAFSLGIGLAATQMRMIRSSLLDVFDQDYIRFARSKGIAERKVVFSEALKNAMIPVVTVLGSEIGSLLGGAVVTESIFGWPGVGRLIVNSIGKRDYPMIQGATLVFCLLFLIINLMVDITYAYLNPRIKMGK